jgi:hypothetical protein
MLHPSQKISNFFLSIERFYLLIFLQVFHFPNFLLNGWKCFLPPNKTKSKLAWKIFLTNSISIVRIDFDLKW